MANSAELSELRNRMISLTHLLENCKNISPETISLVDDFYIDALISTDREMIDNSALLMRTALSLSSQRIVVLQSQLTSEQMIPVWFTVKSEI